MDAAAKQLTEAMECGDWLILENCHLAMDATRTLFASYANAIKTKDVHDEFRLWFVTTVSSRLPIKMLRHSIKLVANGPRNGRQRCDRLDKLHTRFRGEINTLPSSESLSQPESERSRSQQIIRRLIKFHCVVAERRGFGPIGWTEPYLFPENVCINIISNVDSLFQQKCNVTNELIERFALECNYDGSVWTANGRTLLRSLFASVFDGGADADGGATASAEFVYLNSNSSFLKNVKRGEYFISSALAAQELALPTPTSAHDSSADIDRVLSKCKETLNMLPLAANFPITENDPFGSVLKNESLRFDKLLKCVRKCLSELCRALEGTLDLTVEMEEMFDDVLEGRMPAQWKPYSYPSSKSFASYARDLGQRVDFFQRRKRNRTPYAFWFAAFFHPAALLTTVTRQFAQLSGAQFDDVIVNHSVVATTEV